MSTHPTKTGKFEVRWREGSKNRSRTFDRKTDAKRFDQSVRHKTQMGETVPKRTGGDTLAEFFARWLTNKQLSLSPRTLNLYKELFARHAFDQVGYLPLRKLDPRRMEEWQAERLEAGGGKEVIAKTQQLLSQVFNKAVHNDEMASNPLEGLDKPRSDSERLAPLPPEAIERIRAHFLPDRMGDAVLVCLMAYGGLRVGEALALQWEDFSKGNSLWISHSLEDDGSLKRTKTGKERYVPLCDPVAEDLLAWRRETGTHGFVFPRAKDGKGWTKTDRNNWRRRYFNPALSELSIPHVPVKNLRHSAASLMIASGMRPTEVAERLGHSLAVSFDTYQRYIREMEGQPVRPMDEVIREARSAVARGSIELQENGPAKANRDAPTQGLITEVTRD